jgi:hypothetical protein
VRTLSKGSYFSFLISKIFLAICAKSGIVFVMNLSYKKVLACRFGPGGIRCSCCNPFRTAKRAKRVSNRFFRRTVKIEIE